MFYNFAHYNEHTGTSRLWLPLYGFLTYNLELHFIKTI